MSLNVKIVLQVNTSAIKSDSCTTKRRKPKGKITIVGAGENNLKQIDVNIPLGVMTAITGVSGSGKSTLVNDILYKALAQKFYYAKDKPGKHRGIIGLENIDKVIIIDQSPIAGHRVPTLPRTPAFSPDKGYLCSTSFCKSAGYLPGRFSFNVKGGRCEACKGDGIITIEMHSCLMFMCPARCATVSALTARHLR